MSIDGLMRDIITWFRRYEAPSVIYYRVPCNEAPQNINFHPDLRIALLCNAISQV